MERWGGGNTCKHDLLWKNLKEIVRPNSYKDGGVGDVDGGVGEVDGGVGEVDGGVGEVDGGVGEVGESTKLVEMY